MSPSGEVVTCVVSPANPGEVLGTLSACMAVLLRFGIVYIIIAIMEQTLTGRSYEEFIRSVLSYRVESAPKGDRYEMSSDGLIGSVTSAMTRGTPPSVDLRSYQTGIKQQEYRGTCWAFAAVAALEAYYKRHHQLDLRLSEHYLVHIHHLHAAEDAYFLEDRAWGSQIIREMTAIPLPLEADCPYKTKNQLSQIRGSYSDENSALFSEANVPRRAYLNAKYRVLRWENVYRTVDLLELLFEKLDMGFEICADFTPMWKKNDGIYDYDQNAKPNVGHDMLIVGYDKRQSVSYNTRKGIFLLKNSWGGSDFTRVTFDFMEKCYKNGHIILEATAPDRNDFKRQRWLGIWNWNNDGWSGKAHIRCYKGPDLPKRDFFSRIFHFASFKMGTLYLDNGEVHEIDCDFHDDDRVILRTSNEFHLNMFTWEPMHAGGYGLWNGMRFGAFMSKQPIVNVHGKNFNVRKWEGRWRMNNDGWHGILTITNHDGSSFSAWYEPTNSDRRVLSVWGNPGQETWHIELYIQNTFDTTKFYLYYHTWTQNLFSGYTEWGGKDFGLFGVKEA